MPTSIELTYPVAGYRYNIDGVAREVYRSLWRPIAMSRTGAETAAIRVPPPAPLLPSPTSEILPASQQLRPQIATEKLGTQMIEGLLAEGTRSSILCPEGILGNDRPITTIAETCMSVDLKIVLLAKSSDPRTGDSTTRISKISQAELSPALFQVPADYAVIDEPTLGTQR